MSPLTLPLDYHTMDTDAFVEWLQQNKLKRGYIVCREGEVRCSNPLLKDFAQFISNSPDYTRHEGIFFEIEPETRALFVAAIHRSKRGAGQGGTRLKRYDSVKSIFDDVMRLSKGMTEKNAFAQIWWGGGKSVIHPAVHPKSIPADMRTKIFSRFGRFIASLKGLYVCAEDMNTTPEDMRLIHANNRFCTCVPTEIGGSSNPSKFTAKGVFRGLLAGVHFLQKIKDPDRVALRGIHLLVQGAGNVGFHLIELAVQAGAQVTVFDNYPPTRDKLRQHFPKEQVKVIDNGDDLYKIPADVFSPNAIGATLNDETIPQLQVKIIAGAANNQLLDAERHAEMIHQRGILYIPDFVINRMGIVNCADEQYGYLPEEIERKLAEVYPSTYDLLEKANADNISPQFKAIELAEKLSQIEHPIWKHRGAKIINHLIETHWEDASL